MMGVAREWLGVGGCRALAEEILQDVKPKRGELWAHCPWHSEKTPGGAFSYNPEEDVAKCLSCSGSGDLVNVWAAVKGIPTSEAFIEFRKKYGPSTPAPRRQPRPARPTPRQAAEPKPGDPAPEAWRERASSFVRHSYDRLMNNEEALKKLESQWGITEATAAAWGIGLNDRDKWPTRAAWGLPSEPGKEKLWLPRGLVLPQIVEGTVRKIKIRRPDPRTTWGADLRYWEVPGGENWRFHIYASGRPAVIVVLEAERDAALVWQQCDHALLGAIAGGGAAKRPSSVEVCGLLRSAQVILIALDTDAAGAKNARHYWLQEFGYAIHWPVPARYGKDVGEAWAGGLDIRQWVEAGLPGYVQKGADITNCCGLPTGVQEAFNSGDGSYRP
jgi:hypothetical protein